MNGCGECAMNTGLRLVFRKGDWLAILLVAALAVCTAAAYAVGDSTESGMVQVFQEGKLIREMALETDAKMIVEGDYRNVVTVADGKVFFSNSDCPGRDCVHSGRISLPGRSLVCLPNRVEIRVVGSSDVDFTVR